ncbi:MAG: glycine cleavage system aminomethyltransferase GcvT [Bdellovibrionales bacterium]|nr:glycine cleavage system aminomethyltransferase GcvT [Bdellovibrionales bacterium]
MGNQESLRRTPLYQNHLDCGGKMVPFAGWEMPVQYPAGVVEEHLCVRSRVGIFDVSHMGEIEVRGPGAEAYLDYITCNAVSTMKDGQAQYSALPNSDGGIVDDIIIYRYNPEHYLLCVNASNAEIDFQWLQDQQQGSDTFHSVSLKNLSDEYAQIAVQGPKAFSLLQRIFGQDFQATLKPFWFAPAIFDGEEVLVARTGYTGEDGVEVFVSPKKASALWTALLSEGEVDGILPCGLGARDSLRLEVCYPLHGHELSPKISAIESGLGWIVKPNKKGDFIGRSILEKQKAEGSPRKLVGFFVEDKGIVREETKVFSPEGIEVGFVTSGTKTPSVGKESGKALGLALVKRDVAEIGQELFGEVRGRKLKLQVVETPFYKR